MRRQTLAPCLLGVWLSFWVPSTLTAQEAAGRLERAPGDLGAARFEGSVSLAAAGAALFLYETENGTLRRFQEDGDPWGKAVSLLSERGTPFRVRAPRLAIGRGRLLVAGLTEVGVFKLNGDRVALSRSLALTLAASDFGPRGWLLALAQVGSNVRFSGSPALSPDKMEARSRLVAVDHDLEVMATGLPLDGDVPSSLAAARALRLAFDGENVWAAELANYRVYRLTEGLNLEETLEDPGLFLEEGSGEERQPSETADSALPPAMARYIEGQSEDLVTGEKPRLQPNIYRYKSVIRDIEWDPVDGRLVLLLAAGGAAPGPAVDLLEPATGEVRRLELELPADVAGQEVAQLAITEGYLWVRNLDGGSPTLRLPRSELAKAVPVLQAEGTPPPAPKATDGGSGAPAKTPQRTADTEPAKGVLAAPVRLTFPGAVPVPLLLESLGKLFFEDRVEIDPGVMGTFSGSLEGSTLEKALDAICESAGCRWSVEGQPPRLVVEPASP